MMRAKVAADITGDQQRMDEVFPNIFIGNKFAAEDANYLALNNISHVLNMAATVWMIEADREPAPVLLLFYYRTAGTLYLLPSLSYLSTTLTSLTSK